MGDGGRRATGSRPLLIICLIIGAGLILAPVAFQMFTRAPKGGDMLDGFRPYMNEETITGFQGDMDDIDAAVDEAEDSLEPMIEEQLALAGAELEAAYPSYVTFTEDWPAIYDDMSNMLTTMNGNIDNFEAVDALPPFALFPWFFVVPGALIVGASVWGLLRCRGGTSCTGPRVALGVLGVGLILAPAVFQMFSRAPLGGEMIDDFESLMTEDRIREIQSYFVVIAAGEGTIRARILADIEEQGGPDSAQAAEELPALALFSENWPTTSAEMAPMIGAMSDNLDNYLAVAALPPFPLFPWFFVIPGVLVGGMALAMGRGADADPTEPEPDPDPTTDTDSPPPQGGTP